MFQVERSNLMKREDDDRSVNVNIDLGSLALIGQLILESQANTQNMETLMVDLTALTDTVNTLVASVNQLVANASSGASSAQQIADLQAQVDAATAADATEAAQVADLTAQLEAANVAAQAAVTPHA